MAKMTMNLQDSFLNQARRDGSEIEMVLIDGTSLAGTIRGFDNFTVILNTKGAQHLVYKHAIGQIVSRRPLGRREDAHRPQARPRPQAKPPEEPPSEKKGESFNTLNLSNVVIPEEAGA